VIRSAALLLAPLLLAWAAPEQTPAPGPQPSPAATSLPPGSAVPTVAPSPVSAPTVSPAPAPPVPAPTVSPTAAPAQPSASAPPYRFIYTPQPGATSPPPDAPHIAEIDFTDQTIHQNSDIFLRVVTSQVVANVVVSAMGHGLSIPQVAPGVFGGQSHIPAIPFFMLNRTYDVEVRAQTPDGRTDSVTLPVRLVR